MKKLLLLFVTVVVFEFSKAQTNTFPSSGNVGIGTTSPGSKLEIKSSGNNTEVLKWVASDGSSMGHIYEDGSGNPYFTLANASGTENIVLHGADNGNSYFNTGGNFGIGTTSPLQLLHVAGNIGIGTDASSKAITFYGSNYWHVDNTGSDLRISRGATPGYAELVRFTSNGVAIGTTSTHGYKFAVNGDALFTKVKVLSYGSWPDYVFLRNYKLRPLKDLESYIKENNHLPEVPSASEVEKNGLDLGDNQASLLKKIEELTLYIIDQDKKLDLQNKQINAQQKQITELLELKKDLENIKAKLQN